MRRLLGTGVAAACLAAIVLALTGVAQGSDSYTFDVIFDNARGLVAGQIVKIAGADAGTITKITVTSRYQARIQGTITGPFQFHRDASCLIRPDGLIAENYLECDPGSTRSPLLRGTGGEPPTVPVTQTTEPVDLLDLFNIFNVPTRERFQVLIDELGIATAGRGDDINAILQRANPTLQLAQRVIGILDEQRTQLASAIDATSTIAAEGATHTAAVQAFLAQMAGLVTLTGAHSGNLAVDIHRLPGLLAATTPALDAIDTVARDGTPLLSELGRAAPYLNTVDSTIGPFARQAKPALAALAGAVDETIPTVRQATPVVDAISKYLSESSPSAKAFSSLLVNLLQHGFSENFLSIVYYVAAATSRYDSSSHVLDVLTTFADNGSCLLYATTPTAGCSANYNTSASAADRRGAPHHDSGAATSTDGTSARAGTATTAATGAAGTGTSTSTSQSGTGTGASGSGAAASGPPASGSTTGQLTNLLNYLLK